MTLARAANRSEDDRWHVRKDGNRFWGSGVLLALHDTAGKIVGYAKILRNRTDVKTQTEALDNRVQSLEATLERTRVFLATLAHEMRNPLAPLSNAAQLLRLDPAGKTSEEALRIIDRQVALLSRLVEDLMDTARISAGKVQLKLAVTDLREVFEAAALTARPSAQARGLQFEQVPIAGPVPVCVDSQRMHQVFTNLLDNAIKYTPRGGVGLGLPLVHDLVALHGGTVQARSDGRDKGSVFTVRLPMHRATQP
jgi:two-component system CheB/CheR fusion protein